MDPALTSEEEDALHSPCSSAALMATPLPGFSSGQTRPRPTLLAQEPMHQQQQLPRLQPLCSPSSLSPPILLS